MKAFTWSLLPLLALPVFSADTAINPPAAANAVLVGAITSRHVVKFNYGGHPRVVEPYTYGIASTGEVVLHGYQTDGGSVSGKPPGWRTFNAAGIQSLSVTDVAFAATRPDYSSARPKLDPLWAEASPKSSD